jgi:hypothetical protein
MGARGNRRVSFQLFHCTFCQINCLVYYRYYIFESLTVDLFPGWVMPYNLFGTICPRSGPRPPLRGASIFPTVLFLPNKLFGILSILYFWGFDCGVLTVLFCHINCLVYWRYNPLSKEERQWIYNPIIYLVLCARFAGLGPPFGGHQYSPLCFLPYKLFGLLTIQYNPLSKEERQWIYNPIIYLILCARFAGLGPPEGGASIFPTVLSAI